MLACLIAASAALYTAGMVLNDVFDFEIDAEGAARFGRCRRGSICRCTEAGLRAAAIGLALGWLAGYLPGAVSALPWRSGAIASLLAVCILAYDGFLKKTPLGPLGMGACRFFNVLWE